MPEKSIKCLVVETDSQRAQRIAEFLEALEGYQVETAICDSLESSEDLLAVGGFDFVISKGVLGDLEHEQVVSIYRQEGQDLLILCLLEDEEKSAILTSPQNAADDYLFYRDLSQGLLLETISHAFERRSMLAELKANQVAKATEAKGAFRALLHRLDMAVFLFSRLEGELLFCNKVADTWAEGTKQALLEELFDYGVLQVEEIELEIETKIAAVPCAELKSVRIDWRGQDCSLVTLRNISKRKRAESAYKTSQRRLDLALKSSGLGLWSWDLRKNVLHFSERWKAQLGYSGSDFPDTMQAYKKALHVDDRAIVEATFARALRGDIRDIELKYRMRHVDGEYRWILCRAEVYPDVAGKLSHFLGTHIDITERRENPGSQGLEETLGERIGARLERLASEIEVSAARVRSNFRGDSAIVEDILELERLSRSFSGLNEVLQLNDDRSDSLHEAIDLRYELQQVFRSQASLLPSRIRLELNEGEEVHIHGISRRGIRFALTEALACVAESVSSDFKSEVSVSVCLHEGEDNEKRPSVLFQFKGEPIPEPDLLILSKTPRMEVRSNQEVAAVRLELLFEAEVNPQLSHEDGALLALLADDEDVLRMAIQTMLEKLGFEVVIAGDGAEALEVFSKRKDEFDLAVVDMQMPHIDGYAVVGSIHAARPDLPVIRMSGDVNDERSELFNSDNISFLAKPFGIAALKSSIEELKLDLLV